MIRTPRFPFALAVLLVAGLAGCSGDETHHYTTVVATGPFVSAVSPSGGDTAGGTPVTITGTNFVDGATVDFGSTAAANVTFVSDSELTAETPAGTAGAVSVKVINPDGKSGTLANAFTYADSPDLTSVSPSVVETAGGTTVTLTGTGFQPGATVSFGTGRLFPWRVFVVSATSISVVAPPLPAGGLDVTVTNPDGQSATLSSGITYNDPPSVTTDLADGTTLLPGVSVTFSVTVTDPESDNVNLDLLNPPPGCVFSPVAGGTSPATAKAHWLVSGSWKGDLLFEASDSVLPARKIRLSVAPEVTGGLPQPVVADVTGDGIDDTVVPAQYADVSGVTDTGAIYVWAGSASPSSHPTATLTVPGAAAGDRLCYIGSGQGLLCADVTGDGVLDVVAGARHADGPNGDEGAVYVWAGGSGLTGSPSPTATLTVTGAAAVDLLCVITSGQGLLCADVTGDGVLDVVAGACYADVGGTVDTGAVYLWQGGSALTGALAPTTAFIVPSASSGDQLGR